MKSEAARLWAVRRVTQDNQGKKTAGVDGMKSVKPQERLVMASHIQPMRLPTTSLSTSTESMETKARKSGEAPVGHSSHD